MDGEDKLAALRACEAKAAELRRELGLPEATGGLSRREERLVTAERVAHLGSWTWCLQTEEIGWSDEFFRILGLVPGSVTPTTEAFYGAVHHEDLPRLLDTVQRALQAGVPETIEFRVVRPSGEVRHVRMDSAFMRDARGVLTEVIGTVLDETDKVATARQLARIVADLNQAHHVAGLGSWRWDLAEQRLEWSEGMYRILQIDPACTPSEALFFAHVHPDDFAFASAATERAVATGIATPLEIRILRDDGSQRDVVVRARATFDEAGKLTGFHGVLQDVTERRALEEQLRHSQKMEAVGTLAGGVAHDFNNYLMILSGHVELLAATLPADHPAHRSLAAIEQACERCANLTRQLLTLSRKRPTQPRLLQVPALIEGLVPTLRSVLGATIALELELDPDASPIAADPSQIEQVLMNLVLNARDAMPGGGVLTLVLENVCIDDGHAQSKHCVRLTVRDTGCGIPDELRSRVFEPFFTTKPVGRGTGLGLAAVYGIVQGAGGSIAIESKVGRGSAFRVYLPPATGTAEPQPITRVPETIHGRSLRVLLVEDEALVRDVLQRQLMHAGYRVLSTGHGREALALLAGGEQVDLVLSDMVMPQMGGAQLALELRARYPGLPCLLMTGYAAEAIVEVDLGLDHPTLRKPFGARELLSALAKVQASHGAPSVTPPPA